LTAAISEKPQAASSIGQFSRLIDASQSNLIEFDAGWRILIEHNQDTP
jgi:hypothetical protein